MWHVRFLGGTLPQTNITRLKIGHPKRKIHQPFIFKGYVCFREGTLPKHGTWKWMLGRLSPFIAASFFGGIFHQTRNPLKDLPCLYWTHDSKMLISFCTTGIPQIWKIHRIIYLIPCQSMDHKWKEARFCWWKPNPSFGELSTWNLHIPKGKESLPNHDFVKVVG